MGLSRAALAAITADPGAFRSRLSALVTDHGLDPDRLPRSGAAGQGERADAVDADRTSRERRLVERVRLLDDIPVGLTLTGPAYRDTPIVYVNRWFRSLTGYSLDALRGRNPRVFQAPGQRRPLAPISARRCRRGHASRSRCGTAGATVFRS